MTVFVRACLIACGILSAPAQAVQVDVAAAAGPNAMAAFDASRLVVVYKAGDGSLAMARSQDAGASFATRPVDPHSIGDWVDVATLGDATVLIAYAAQGNKVLRFARSRDGGDRFDSFSAVEREGLVGAHCSLAAPGGDTVFVAYYDADACALELARSEDLGDTWDIVRVTDGADAGRWCDLVALDAERLVLVYQDFATKQLFCARSLNGGDTWMHGAIDEVAGTGAYASAVRANDGALLVSYRDFGRGRLMCARSDTEGATWSSNEVLELGRAPAWTALSALSAQRVVAATYDPLARDLKLALSPSGGRTWISPQALAGGASAANVSLLRRSEAQFWMAYVGGDEPALRVELISTDRLASRADAPTPESLGGVEVEVAETSDGAPAGGRLTFSVTGADETAPSERMVLTGEGRLGVGTPQPKDTLHVSGRARVEDRGGSFFVRPSEDKARIGVGRGEALHLTTGRDAIVIQANGDVGIGTADPQAPLEVASDLTDDQGTLVHLRQRQPGRDLRVTMGTTTEDPTSFWSLAALAGGGFSVERAGFNQVAIDAEGRVGLGVDRPTNILTVARASETDPLADAWQTYSSERWKRDVEPLDDAVDLVRRLRGVRFEWRDRGEPDVGVLAEEVANVLPELVGRDGEGRAASVDYGRLSAVLIEAVKEQADEIDALHRRLDELSARLERAERRASEPTEGANSPRSGRTGR